MAPLRHESHLTAAMHPLSDKIFVKLDGERLVNNCEEKIILFCDTLSSPAPIPVVCHLSGAAVSEVTFEVSAFDDGHLPCAESFPADVEHRRELRKAIPSRVHRATGCETRGSNAKR